ncbi:hypothetical protein D3C81_1667230 [compost metagenome]
MKGVEYFMLLHAVIKRDYINVLLGYSLFFQSGDGHFYKRRMLKCGKKLHGSAHLSTLQNLEGGRLIIVAEKATLLFIV